MDLFMHERPVYGQVELHVCVGVRNVFVGCAHRKLLDK